MTSEEDEEERTAAFEGEDQTGRKAFSAADRQGFGDAPSPVHHDGHTTISSKLEDEWPEIELGGEKGLVVCSIDVQLLTGGWAEMSQSKLVWCLHVHTSTNNGHSVTCTPHQ